MAQKRDGKNCPKCDTFIERKHSRCKNCGYDLNVKQKDQDIRRDSER